MTVEAFVDALLARRAHLFTSIRHHLDEVVDVDRLIARHLPGHEPLDREWMLPFFPPVTRAEWVKVPVLPFDDEAAQAEFALVDADSDAAPPSPTAAPAAVDEDRDEHAPDVLPGPPSPTIPVVPAGGDLVANATAANRTQRSPRPSERGEPSIRCQHPGCDRVFATNQARATHTTRAHPDATADIPGAPWDYAEVARVAREAQAAGQSMTAAVQALRDGCKVGNAQMAISTARKRGHHIPYGNTPTARPTDAPSEKKQTAKSPVEQPAEGGRVIRCGTCGWQTGPSRNRDLLKHTLAEHGREPSKAERTPIIDERAA